MSTQQRCSARVYTGSFSGYPCGKTGKVERNGKWYCGTHDPERIAKKRAAKAAEWDAGFEARRAAWVEEAAQQAALERDAALWRAHVAKATGEGA